MNLVLVHAALYFFVAVVHLVKWELIWIQKLSELTYILKLSWKKIRFKMFNEFTANKIFSNENW